MLTPFDASLGAGRCRGARLLEVTRARGGGSSNRAGAAIGERLLLRIEDAARGSASQTRLADRLGGGAAPGPARHPSWSGARGELDRGAPSRGVSYGRFRPHDLSVSSRRFVTRLQGSPRRLRAADHHIAACRGRFPFSIRQSSVLFSFSATAYPAYIPRDVAGTFRRYPAIPAKGRTQSPALAGHPRLSPPSTELPRPACRAGGRGFESRRSRKIPHIAMSCCRSPHDRPPASFHSALIPHRK